LDLQHKRLVSRGLVLRMAEEMVVDMAATEDAEVAVV
jgi:hypothetical protein